MTSESVVGRQAGAAIGAGNDDAPEASGREPLDFCDRQDAVPVPLGRTTDDRAREIMRDRNRLGGGGQQRRTGFWQRQRRRQTWLSTTHNKGRS